MKSLNRVMLIGHVGKDPEIAFSKGGTKCATFSLATNEKWKDKTSGKPQERTDWHRLVAWANVADLIEKFVKKGSPLFIEGNLRPRSYEKDGETRYVTEIQVRDLVLLSTRDQGKAVAEATAEGPITDDDIPF